MLDDPFSDKVSAHRPNCCNDSLAASLLEKLTQSCRREFKNAAACLLRFLSESRTSKDRIGRMLLRPTGRSRKSAAAGFSLVETVLAIGVVSFAMVPILGLIPFGMNTFRDAMNNTVESAIVEQLASEIQRTDFSAQAVGVITAYYDDQGIVAEASNAIFTARITPPQPVVADGIVRSNTAARTVLIRISNRKSPAVNNSYTVIIPAQSSSSGW